MKILIIGYGNDSRNDDGAGWRVLERLEDLRLRGVELLTAHQLEVDVAETIRDYDTVIFVDAAIPESPHAVIRSVVKPDLQSHAVAHYLTPADVLALCRTLYGVEPKGMLYSIRGHDFNFGETLSPETALGVDEVVREIRQLVAILQRGGGVASAVEESNA